MRLLLSLLLLSLFSSHFSYALNEDRLTKIINALKEFRDKKIFKKGEVEISLFLGSKGKSVGYTRYTKGEGKNGVIVVSIGRSESSLSYIEYARDLNELGYSPVYVVDHRGQGFSDRLLWNTQKGYVDKFDYYADDLKLFINGVAKKENPKKEVHLLAHSLGGAIATDMLQRYELDIKAVAFIAPMFGIQLPDSESRILFISDMFCSYPTYLLGLCTFYVPGGKAFDRNVTLADSASTGDPNRFRFMYKIYDVFPELRVGDPTIRWVNESIRAVKRIRTRIDRLKLPMLLLQAENEAIVENSAQEEFCLAAPQCRLVRLLGAKHGIHKERDPIRNNSLKLIHQFFQKY